MINRKENGTQNFVTGMNLYQELFTQKMSFELIYSFQLKLLKVVLETSAGAQ